jgi:hypothetical protein
MARLSAIAALMLVISVPTLAAKKPTMTPMQLQALQSKEFETSKEILFASVVSVFQDLGYQLDSADLPTGFITASSASGNRTNFLEALGGVASSGNTRATAFVEAMPNGMARVRLNFLNTKQSSSWYGQSSKKDKPVLDPKTYQVAWDKIDEAIFVRSALSSKPLPSVANTSSPSPLPSGPQPDIPLAPPPPKP